MIPSEIAPRTAGHSLRPVVMGRRGVVVAGTPLAAHVGTRMLMCGGNAIDAAIAAAAVQAVVMPHMNGLGGDLFLLHYRPDGTIRALNGTGPAPQGATVDAYRARGLRTMPSRGIETVSVPGAVDGWFRALRDCGTLSPTVVFGPALDFASNGFPVHKNFLRYLASPAFQEVATVSPALARAYQGSAQPLAPGDYLIQPQMARTFERLLRDGPEDFYRGVTADLILRTSAELHGFLSKEDLASYASMWADPISTTYKGSRVYQVPPNSQGITMLQQLKLLEPFDLMQLGHNTTDYIHILVEAKKLAFKDRDQYVADPEAVSVPVGMLLAPSRTRDLVQSLDVHRSAEVPAPTGHRSGGETTCLAAVDAEGQAVVLIQSLFDDFGSGVFVEEAGFALHNRMSGFQLIPGHANALAPRKRPLHTLCCSMVTQDDKLRLVYATPGGHAQTQTLVQVLNNLMVFGMDVQESVEAPRFAHEGTSVLLEGRIGAETRKELVRRGHAVEFLPPWSSVVGGCAAIAVHDGGTYFAGADPRRDSYASLVV
jgi:gamma-glutamyltranspeptidase / glutathione hydrolase